MIALESVRRRASAPLAAGVDVSVRRGLDVVVLDQDRHLVGPPHGHVAPSELSALLAGYGPELAVVAIDSPPGPGARGPTRPCEQVLRHRNIKIFSTPAPDAGFDRPLFDWVRVGMAAFAAAASAGFPLLSAPGLARGHALEVFPHATDVVLRGSPPPPGTTRSPKRKLAARRSTLIASGVDVAPLGTIDAVDAALAALTGLFALAGAVELVGDPPFLLALPAPRITLPR